MAFFLSLCIASSSSGGRKRTAAEENKKINSSFYKQNAHHITQPSEYNEMMSMEFQEKKKTRWIKNS